MRKFISFIALIVFFLLGTYYGLMYAKQKIKSDLRISLPSTPFYSPSLPEKNLTIKHESVFVPYWTVSSTLKAENYEEYYYFGVTPGMNGIDKTEEGYTRLSSFLRYVEPEKSLLVIRMLNREQNTKILENKLEQEELIESALALVKERGMKGIVLDLEHSVFPFDSLIAQVTSLTTHFSEKTKKENLQFYTALYGDVFYRPRPFNVKEIAKVSDKVIFMAYDFHKANGNPGPNFPLSGEEIYGYDFEELIKDAEKVMSLEKVNIAFGYFGYDWEVKEENKAVKAGVALSTNVITQRYLDCSSCIVLKDSDSEETKVTYTVGNTKHIIWFEDYASVKEKQLWLLKYGVNNFSYWAYGYYEEH